MEKLGSSLIGRGDVKIGEYQNSNLCSSSIPDCSPVVSLLSLKCQRRRCVVHPFPACRNNTKLCTETLVPTSWDGQYLTHARNHITLATTAMDSCFTPIGAHQHCIALGSTRGETAYQCRNSLPRPFRDQEGQETLWRSG